MHQSRGYPSLGKARMDLGCCFDDIEEEYNLFTAEKTDTLNIGGYGVEMKVQIKTENMKKDIRQCYIRKWWNIECCTERTSASVSKLWNKGSYLLPTPEGG